MRNIWSALLAIILIPALSSCSEDFEVAAPYKNITVVYGILNMADTAHYVRVQKAFLDDNKSALDMAREVDSNFYAASNLTVQMREIDATTKAIRATYPMTLVDLTSEGYPKKPGAFFNAPNLAYKLKHTLDPAYIYRVVISNMGTGEVDSAETGLINNSSQVFKVNEFDRAGNYSIDFNSPSSPNTVYGLFINNPIQPNAKLFEATIRFHYVNKDMVTGVQQDDSVDFTFASKAYDGTPLSLTVPHVSIFNFLKAAIQPPSSANVNRYMDSCDVFVWAGSQELYAYQQYSQIQSGLTGDQIKPLYTNIKGANVLGLFASRGMRSKFDIPISPATMDTLQFHPITSSLRIVGVSDH